MAAAQRSSGRPVRPPPLVTCTAFMRAAAHLTATGLAIYKWLRSAARLIRNADHAPRYRPTPFMLLLCLSSSHAGGRDQPRRGVSVCRDRADQAHGRRVRPAALGARARKC